jgi:uncharacterized membrane protein YuzA (DUF378 family)
LITLSVFGLIGFAGYTITTELFGRATPTNLFDETFEIVRISDEVIYNIISM